jgi:hypothetical protein
MSLRSGTLRQTAFLLGEMRVEPVLRLGLRMQPTLRKEREGWGTPVLPQPRPPPSSLVVFLQSTFRLNNSIHSEVGFKSVKSNHIFIHKHDALE